MNRTEFLNKIIEEQRNVVANLTESVEHYETSSDLDENATIDRDDLSQQDQSKDMQLRFSALLNEAQSNLSFLESIQDEHHTEIENGAILETDTNYLFVGVSVPRFEFNGKEVISFSEDAPIFNEIKSKKIGEKITIGETTSTIQSIY